VTAAAGDGAVAVVAAAGVASAVVAAADRASLARWLLCSVLQA